MEKICSLFFMIYFLYKYNGINAVIDFFNNIIYTCWEFVKLMNIFSITIYNHSILSYLYGTCITYIIVGILLKIFSIPKNKIGKFCGKIAFKIVSIPVSFILDLISKLILNFSFK